MAEELDKKISQLPKKEQIDGEEKIPIAAGGENYHITPAQLKEYGKPDLTPYMKTADAQQAFQPQGNYQPAGDYVTNESLEAKDYATKDYVNEQIAGAEQGRYALAEWTEGELDPEAASFVGDPGLLGEWHPFLLDTTDNAGVTTHPVGQLKRNNYLRFEDGTFAPTVGITEEQRAQCDAELYLNPEHTEKYCDAGAFDAEAFYNEYGMGQKLYNASGGEITHILRPWETVETKYDVKIGRKDTVYLIDQIKGRSGKTWRGISTTPKAYDGIDASQWKLVPTAISPGPVCTVGGKTRNFFYLYEGETNCQNREGAGILCTMFKNGRTYPRVSDMHQVNNMNYARANNADNTLPYPWAEGGYHALNTFVTCMEALYGTKALHKNTLFSSGVSSNDGCTDEASWKLQGGMRYKLHSAQDWTYGRWNTTPADLFYGATQEKTYFSNLLNSEYPKEQCMEAQMAASFAVETGVAPGEEFSFYGGTYWYDNPTGANGLQDGEMNARVYKRMAQTFNAYDAEGASQSWDVEVVLRVGLMNGVNTSGDVYVYWGGGYEQVATTKYLQETQKTGNPVDLYLQPDQTKWVRETTYQKSDLGTFLFEGEDGYPKLGTHENLGNGHALKRKPYAAWKTEKGGSLLQGECFYAYDDNNYSTVIDQRTRLALRFRGAATYGYCSARMLAAIFAASVANRACAGSAQALIEAGAAPPQAE